MELAQDCARTCHVLRLATEGRVADNLSSPYRKRIEDLGRCVHPVQPALLTVTSDIRVIRQIESVVIERANRTCDSQGHHPESTEERLIALRREMREILRVFDVRGSWLTMVTLSELPQEELVQGGALEASEIGHHTHGSGRAEPPASTSAMVRFCFTASTPLPANRRFRTCRCCPW